MLDSRAFECRRHCIRGIIWILDWGISSIGRSCLFSGLETVIDADLQAAALVPHITKNQQAVPLRLGLQFLVASIPMIIGNPIAGAILKAQNGKFWGVQVFTGLMMFASAVLYTVSRVMFGES